MHLAAVNDPCGAAATNPEKPWSIARRMDGMAAAPRVSNGGKMRAAPCGGTDLRQSRRPGRGSQLETCLCATRGGSLPANMETWRVHSASGFVVRRFSAWDGAAPRGELSPAPRAKATHNEQAAPRGPARTTGAVTLSFTPRGAFFCIRRLKEALIVLFGAFSARTSHKRTFPGPGVKVYFQYPGSLSPDQAVRYFATLIILANYLHRLI